MDIDHSSHCPSRPQIGLSDMVGNFVLGDWNVLLCHELARGMGSSCMSIL